MTEQDFDELTLEDTGGESGSSPSKGPRAFRNISRELEEEDLANPSPAVLKLLLNEIDRLEIEKEEYKPYMKRFYDADRKVSVLEQKSRIALGGDIVFGGCLTVGALLLGLAHGLWSHQPFGWIVVVAGVVLFLIGILAKVKAS